MDKEIAVRDVASLTEPTVQQTGEKNVSITNQPGGTVNVISNYYPKNNGANAEDVIAVHSFSSEYYQLLVTCEENVFADDIITITENRALTKGIVPSEIFERCSSLTETGIEELKTFPAIICQENTELKGKANPAQWALFGYIRRVQKVGRNIKVVFKGLTPFKQQILCDKKNAVFFGLNMDCAITDLNYSAWSVHKVNVFEALDEAGIPGIPRPM